MTLFRPWTADLCINNSLIDSQHKNLIRISELAESCATELNVDYSIFVKLLNDFATYAMEHFSEEERCLELNGSPNLETHRKAHSAYLEKVTVFLLEVSAGLIDRNRLHALTLEYLVDHMRTFDQVDKAYLGECETQNQR